MKTLGTQDFDRNLTIQSADSRFCRHSIANKKYIGAAKQLDLNLPTKRAEFVKLPGEFTN
jgi:hypothetical protein